MNMPPIVDHYLPDGLLVHVGCGPIVPDGWVNLDASWNLLAKRVPGLRSVLSRTGLISPVAAAQAWSGKIRYCDVTRGLPFANGDAAVVYASHVLEHLTHSQARAFLQESFRVLAPGGVIRLVVPDLERMARGYLAKKENGHADVAAADEFMRQMMVSREEHTRSPLLKFYRAYLDTLSHKWMYDTASLKQLMAEAGFTQLAARGYLDSRISAIADVEREGRFEDGICVEGVR